MKKYMYITLILISGLFSSCIEDVGADELGFSKKTMILGYVGSHNEPAKVRILESVPLVSTNREFNINTSATVRMMEQSPTGGETIYEMPYNTEKEAYLTAESGIVKRNYAYWIEVSVADKTWKSNPSKVLNLPIEVDVTETIIDAGSEEARYDISVTDQQQDFYGYIIELFDRNTGVDFFRAMEEGFNDRTFRVDSELSVNVYSDITDTNSDVYIVQLPHEINELLRNWALIINGTDGDDFFAQVFRVPPGNLGSNFFDENGQFAEDTTGFFFPAQSVQYERTP